MPGQWAGRARTQRCSTKAWAALRLLVLERDQHTCQLAFTCCTGTADQACHIVAHADGGTDDPDNLRAGCTPCHARETSQHANAARARQTRPARRHPGLLP